MNKTFNLLLTGFVAVCSLSQAQAARISGGTEFRLIESASSSIGTHIAFEGIAGGSLGVSLGAEWGTQRIQKTPDGASENLDYFPLLALLTGTYECVDRSCLSWEVGGGASYVAGESKSWNPLFHAAWGWEFQHGEKRRLMMKIGARAHFQQLEGLVGETELGSGLFMALGSRF